MRRTTIRKRMRAKLRQIEQQLRERMDDPLPQTGQWLQSIVQGYFNSYAVPGNLTSLGVFRDRALVLRWRTIRQRSQKRRINWTRTGLWRNPTMPGFSIADAGEGLPFPCTPSPKTQICTDPTRRHGCANPIS